MPNINKFHFRTISIQVLPNNLHNSLKMIVETRWTLTFEFLNLFNLWLVFPSFRFMICFLWIMIFHMSFQAQSFFLKNCYIYFFSLQLPNSRKVRTLYFILFAVCGFFHYPTVFTHQNVSWVLLLVGGHGIFDSHIKWDSLTLRHMRNFDQIHR